MLYATHESKKLGSDWTCICKDLRSIRGVKQRLLRGAWPKGKWYIYRCFSEEWYKSDQHKLVGTLEKK